VTRFAAKKIGAVCAGWTEHGCSTAPARHGHSGSSM